MPYSNRIRYQKLMDRVSSPEEAATIIKHGMTIAVSGYTPTGYPKVIPGELVKRAASGEALNLTLFGVSVGPEIDRELTKAGIISRRLPFQGNNTLSKAVNERKISYAEAPLGKVPQQLKNGFFGDIDVAVIETLLVTEKGWIVPTTSVGLTPAIIDRAKEIILEINLSCPIELEGLHDIYIPGMPPYRKPIPLQKVTDRIGEPFIRVDPEKIKHIVISNIPDTIDELKGQTTTIKAITDNLLNFLEQEVAQGRLPEDLLPIQSGLGNLANGIIHGFKQSNFNNLEFYCGILQEAVLDLIDSGKARGASGSGFTPTNHAMRRIIEDPAFYRKNMVIRPVDVSNNAEIINRLGIIALNHGLEVDIYGNTNTSHIMGNKVVNGIGGGTEFAHNASLSVMLLPATGKDKDISAIVPMASHIDIIEHHVDILITDIGIADLRGKDPVEKAKTIIDHCADPLYRQPLKNYLHKAIKVNGGHQPHILEEGYNWHLKMIKEGRMWD